MRGSPILRLLFLAVFLVGAGILVAQLAGPAPSAPFPRSDDQGDDKGTAVPTFVEATLSAPAKRVSLSPLASPATPALDANDPELTFDDDLAIELTASGSARYQATVAWDNPARSNFLLLAFEPEGLETKTVTLHFPPGVTSVPVQLNWPHAANAP